jgi:hypothetical protein
VRLDIAIQTRSFHEARDVAHDVRRYLGTARRELAHAGPLASSPDARERLVALDVELTTLTARAMPLLARAPKPAAPRPEAQHLIAHGPELHAGHGDDEEERAWHATQPEGQVIDASSRFAERRAATIDAPASFDENRATLDIHESAPHRDDAPPSLDPAAAYDENRATLDMDAHPVQRRASGAVAEQDIPRAAAVGITGSASALPHLAAIQRSFGAHDVTGIQAHVGGAAANASRAIGAEAYATGDHVAFARDPDLHTAAHEAAHVVQQRAGVHLKGGVGEVGDPYEQQADAIADRVVRGESAADILPAARGASQTAVQMKKKRKEKETAGGVDVGVEQAITRARGVLDTIEKVLDTLDQNPGSTSLIDAMWSMFPSAKHAIEDAQSALATQQAAVTAAGLTGAPLPSVDIHKLTMEIDALEGHELRLETRAKQHPPQSATTGAGEGLVVDGKIHTGIATIDLGPKCEQGTGGRCLWSSAQRQDAILYFNARVLRALTNEQAGIQNERDAVERTTQSKEGLDWMTGLVFGLASDGIINAFIGGLQSVVVRRLEKEAEAVADETVTGAGDAMRVGASRIGESSRIEDIAMKIPEKEQTHIANIKALIAKGAAPLQKKATGLATKAADKAIDSVSDPDDGMLGLDDGADGKLTFLSLVQDMASTMSQTISEEAPAYLDDVDLASAIQMFDVKYHSVAHYQSIVHGWVKQYDRNKIGELGELRGRYDSINEFVYQVNQVQAFGKVRSAIFEWVVTTQNGNEAYSLHKPKFVRFVDQNFVPLAKARSKAGMENTFAGFKHSEFSSDSRNFDVSNGLDEIDADGAFELMTWISECRMSSEGNPNVTPTVDPPEDGGDPMAEVMKDSE